METFLLYYLLMQYEIIFQDNDEVLGDEQTYQIIKQKVKKIERRNTNEL